MIRVVLSVGFSRTFDLNIGQLGENGRVQRSVDFAIIVIFATSVLPSKVLRMLK